MNANMYLCWFPCVANGKSANFSCEMGLRIDKVQIFDSHDLKRPQQIQAGGGSNFLKLNCGTEIVIPRQCFGDRQPSRREDV